MEGKRGVSELISIVLMILITVAAGGLIYAFVFPIVESNIAQSQTCGSIQIGIITENGLTCYDSSSNSVQVEIGRGKDKVNLTGFHIQISGGGKSKSIFVNATANPVAREYGQSAYSQAMTVPKQDGANTYVINSQGIGITNPESVSVAPIVRASGKDRLCSVSASSALNSC